MILLELPTLLSLYLDLDRGKQIRNLTFYFILLLPGDRRRGMITRKIAVCSFAQFLSNADWPLSNYASVPANNNLKSRLHASFHTFAAFSRTKPRLRVIVRGN